MPYQRSLHQYCEPGFFRDPPAEWVTRLREISPVLPNLDRLVFRWMDPTNLDGSDRGWVNNERGQWLLYTAKDIRLVDRDRAQQFAQHWSTLAEHERAGRRAVVSDYQHFMWHTQGLYVKPFLILQGPWGGTPAKYTDKEAAFLQASECFADPFPPGFFPACPFDERTVKQISLRDRLLQCENDLGALAQLDTPGAMAADAIEAQLVKRQTFLDTWAVVMAPSVEFMKSFIFKKEADRILPKAPDGLNNTVAQWKEHWLEHGAVLGAGPAHQRLVQ